MTITEAAEQVLFGKTLEEKLKVNPADLKDSPSTVRTTGIKPPSTPSRPTELRLSENGVRASFPGVNVLDQDRPRGELLHFLANHELLASELMALALLRFPDAPEEYRLGVYEAMREEQMHTLMYMRRMKECGVEFGQLPLNSYFWRLVSPMASPLELVTKLNLTFEQANLDFSHHYAQKFREVGDNATAAVLEKIYQDEIGHVGHGIKWLREWKKPGQTDWDAYKEGLELPFSASKAKGLAPYNPEGRRKAGLSEDFITKLSVYSQSRGRNPTLHWFNPNAETHANASRKSGGTAPPLHLPEKVKRIEADLELLMVSVTKKDDMLALRKMPTVEHLQSLRTAGIELPELIAITDPALKERKLGGLIPWAWSPDASKTLAPFKESLPTSIPDQWRAPLPAETFSKHLGQRLSKKLSCQTEGIEAAETLSAETIQRITEAPSPTRLKLPYACSGRGHFTYQPGSTSLADLEKFLTRSIKTQGSVIIEPEYERVLDFSVHYDLDKEKKEARFRGICIMENTPAGQFKSATVSAKWTSLIPSELAAHLFQRTAFKELFYEKIPNLLPSEIPDYHGPLGIDAFIYKDTEGTLHLRPIVEVNVRHTMGRVALELLRKLNQKKGTLCILSKKETPPLNTIPINDPAHAETLQSYWAGTPV